ncbi:MAG: hypothetical protein AVDCRST_MAG04-2358, partial [uncultured Acetobacteraceae bacterium]
GVPPLPQAQGRGLRAAVPRRARHRAADPPRRAVHRARPVRAAGPVRLGAPRHGLAAAPLAAAGGGRRGDGGPNDRLVPPPGGEAAAPQPL